MDTAVFMLEAQLYTSKERLIIQHPKVFCQGTGKLEGEYHISLNKDAIPIQHSPQQVPVVLRDRLKEVLDRLVTQGIIAPVTQLTPWINSIVVVPKKDGSFANLPGTIRPEPCHSERTYSITNY